MIEVKMARNLTRDGVEGLRWVLLDPLDGAPSATPASMPAGAATATAAAAAATAMAGGAAVPLGDASPGPVPGMASMSGTASRSGADLDPRTTPRQALMLGGLKALVVLLALGAAVATAWRVIGAPRYPGDGGPPAARPAGPAQPAASAPTVTARLEQPAPQPRVQEVSR